MSGKLIPPLALAVVDGHAIFLDCRADRYFTLSPVENDALLRLLRGGDVDARAKRAIAAAVGIEADAASIRSLLVGEKLEIPSGRTTIGRAPWQSRMRAIRNYAGAKVRLRVRGLHAALEHVARIRPEPATRENPAGAVERIASGHEWLARHVTANDACLVRSLALAAHLRAGRCEARLVIGVRAAPFAAHCWVETPDRLLCEDADIVAAFTPILVVP